MASPAECPEMKELHEQLQNQPLLRRAQKLNDIAKLFPVAFIWSLIIGLYVIYMTFHAVPILGMDAWGPIQITVFNFLTFMLVTCYLRCLFTHPGTVPEKDEDSSWEYRAQDLGQGALEPGLAAQKESKRSGDRRHCKWCSKYKPDRCHHCRVCRTCILKMDHHCPWIYNCVGFRNYKYFFLLLLYTTIDLHFIFWSMLSSVVRACDSTTPFMQMFLLLFGETLAAFLGTLVTAFFSFHVWLMFKAMTTIEFCELSAKRSGFNASAYDRGSYGNMKAVLGENMALWFLPISKPEGDGLIFIQEETRLVGDAEIGRQGADITRSPGLEPSIATFASSTPFAPVCSPRDALFSGSRGVGGDAMSEGGGTHRSRDGSTPPQRWASASPPPTAQGATTATSGGFPDFSTRGMADQLVDVPASSQAADANAVPPASPPTADVEGPL